MNKIRKRFLSILLILVLTVGLVACGKVSIDYDNIATFESELNTGANLVGKVVTITVDSFSPQSAFGYNIITGEHLNFVSTDNPNVKVGDTITVKVTKVESMLGSWIITYDKL